MRISPAILLALLSLPAAAQEGIYVGLGLGQFDFKDSESDTLFGNRSDTVSSTKIYGGFEINEHFAIEIGYGRTDDIEGEYSGNDPLVGDFTSIIRTEFTKTAIKAIGQFPRDWGVLLGGLGYFDLDADISLNLQTDFGSFSNQGTVGDEGMMAMLGVEWRFGRFGTGYGIRLEYEWWDIEDADASTIGIGVAYRF